MKNTTQEKQPDDSEALFKMHKKVRDLCLQNAQDFIESAKLLADGKYRHVRFHLSALALEEIGKAELLEMTLWRKRNLAIPVLANPVLKIT